MQVNWRSLSQVFLILALVISPYWSPIVTSANTPLPLCSMNYIEQVESRVFAKTNYERTSRGLTALQPMDSISSVSRSWSQYMSAGHNYYHNPQYLSQYPAGWSAAGENIHTVYTPDCNAETIATNLVNDWMDSEGHRANILTPYFQYLGIGAWTGNWNTGGWTQPMTYSTQNFAAYPVNTTPPQTGAISLSPAVGSSRSIVNISGSGFRPGERVDIRWASGTGRLIGYRTADDTGSFTGRITIPVANPASYRVYSVGTISDITATRYFQITSSDASASASVSPGSGASLSVPVVSGSGFTPGETVYVYWGGPNGLLRARINARADGTFLARITVPGSDFGSHQIYVRGGSSDTRATTLFRVTSSAGVSFNLSQTHGGYGDIIGFIGQGMHPGERVNIRWGGENGRIIGYVTAGTTGGFSGRITIPGAAPGYHIVYAEGTSSSRSSRMNFRMNEPATPILSHSPNPVVPGQVMRIMGSGFAPGEIVDLTWNEPGGLAGYVTVSPAGTINGAVRVPVAGVYAITATGRTSTASETIGINLTVYNPFSVDIGTPEAVTMNNVSATPTVELVSTPQAPEEIVATPNDPGEIELPSTPVATEDVPETPDDPGEIELPSTPVAAEDVTEASDDPREIELPSTPVTAEDVPEAPDDPGEIELPSTPVAAEDVPEAPDDPAEQTAPPLSMDVFVHVVDTSGADVIDACVQLLNPDGSLNQETCDIGADGAGMISDVPEGSYLLRISHLHSGFEPQPDQSVWVRQGMTNPVVISVTAVPVDENPDEEPGSTEPQATPVAAVRPWVLRGNHYPDQMIGQT